MPGRVSATRDTERLAAEARVKWRAVRSGAYPLWCAVFILKPLSALMMPAALRGTLRRARARQRAVSCCAGSECSTRPSPPGGAPKPVLDLVRKLRADGFEVIIAAPRDGVFFDRFSELGISMVELPLSRLGIHHLPLTMQLIRGQRIDIVHTHGKGPGLYGRLAARAFGIPAVHTFHGIHYGSYSTAGQDLYLSLERRLSRLTHTVINVSRSQEIEGLALHLFEPEQSVVVVNGIDVDELERTIRHSAIRRETLGLSPDHFVL